VLQLTHVPLVPGGAVAQLCALRLLQQLPKSQAGNVSVIAFASPAVGNQALARAVQHAGWQDNFKSFLMPGLSRMHRKVWTVMPSCRVKGLLKMNAVLLRLQRTLCRA
jgi:Lipase (class 3)